jgi:hypothetical protein
MAKTRQPTIQKPDTNCVRKMAIPIPDRPNFEWSLYLQCHSNRTQAPSIEIVISFTPLNCRNHTAVNPNTSFRLTKLSKENLLNGFVYETLKT